VWGIGSEVKESEDRVRRAWTRCLLRLGSESPKYSISVKILAISENDKREGGRFGVRVVEIVVVMVGVN
jgi:hypothetical protein